MNNLKFDKLEVILTARNISEVMRYYCILNPYLRCHKEFVPVVLVGGLARCFEFHLIPQNRISYNQTQDFVLNIMRLAKEIILDMSSTMHSLVEKDLSMYLEPRTFQISNNRKDYIAKSVFIRLLLRCK